MVKVSLKKFVKKHMHYFMVWREYFRTDVVEYTRGHGFERLHCFFIKAPITHIITHIKVQ